MSRSPFARWRPLIAVAGVMSAFGHGAAIIAAQTSPPLLGPRASAPWTETDQWVRSQIRSGGLADLEDHCSSRRTTDSRCRVVSARVLREVLTGAQKDAPLSAPVNIYGAHIAERLDLSRTKIVRQLSLTNCTVDGDVDLSLSQASKPISLDGTTVKGGVYAGGLQSDAEVELRSTSAGTTVFYGAKVATMVNIVDSTLGDFFADDLTTGNLYLRSHTKEIHLTSAKISGQVDLSDAAVDGGIAADGIEVGKSFFMNSRDGKPGATYFRQGVSLTFARIGDNLDLRGSTISALDLSGATIGGELRLGLLGSARTEWKAERGFPGTLVLRNTHAGALVDDASAWPLAGYLHLEGFAFVRLGGSEAQAVQPASARPTDWWDTHWVRLDTEYHMAPYLQLASVFLARGEKGAANEIRFLGRQRERDELWARRQWLSWAGQTFLWLVAGYGIGAYTFFVLGWVMLFTLAGASLLWFTVPAARMPSRGRIWCLGAGLSRLLPAIEINKEFADFFNDPNRERLRIWQAALFTGLTLTGWLLGAILVAAIAGLTQNP